MDHDDARRLGRRAMIGRSLVALAATPALGAIGCGGGGGLECEPGSLTPQEQSMRSALHYVDLGDDPARHCIRCALYTGNERACGTCTVVAGAIHPQGTCDSFVARS